MRWSTWNSRFVWLLLTKFNDVNYLHLKLDCKFGSQIKPFFLIICHKTIFFFRMCGKLKKKIWNRDKNFFLLYMSHNIFFFFSQNSVKCCVPWGGQPRQRSPRPTTCRTTVPRHPSSRPAWWKMTCDSMGMSAKSYTNFTLFQLIKIFFPKKINITL